VNASSGLTRILNLIRYGQSDAAGTQYGPANADASGNIISKLAATLAPTGGVDELTAQEPTADAKDPAAGPFFVEALDVIPYTYFFNGATWDRARAAPDNADAQAALGLGTQGVVARLQGWNGATYDRVGTQGDNADAVPVATLGHLKAWAHNGLFNGTTWDRQRGNTELILLPSAVRAVTTTSADITNFNGSKGLFFLDITAVPGASTLTLSIEGKDPVSGNYITLGSGAAQAGIGTSLLSLGALAAYVIPRTFRIKVTQAGAGNFTYSVGGSLTAS
jgi:hypothetical protein